MSLLFWEESSVIKVSVFYPRSAGSQFDIDYYCETHMPMVQQLLGQACGTARRLD